MRNVEFKALRGLTLTKIEGCKRGGDYVTFHTACGRKFRMRHSQECCENVFIEDVAGDVEDLIGSPILLAECVTSDSPPDGESPNPGDCELWTFYKLATVRGYVTLRWYGVSNGYYSVGVDFVDFEEAEPL